VEIILVEYANTSENVIYQQDCTQGKSSEMNTLRKRSVTQGWCYCKILAL